MSAESCQGVSAMRGRAPQPAALFAPDAGRSRVAAKCRAVDRCRLFLGAPSRAETEQLAVGGDEAVEDGRGDHRQHQHDTRIERKGAPGVHICRFASQGSLRSSDYYCNIKMANAKSQAETARIHSGQDATGRMDCTGVAAPCRAGI